MENKKVLEVYNNSELIAGAGFTMKSNYIVPLLSRMVNEKLLNNAGSTVLQIILQYKHTEENPYPSRDEIARLLGKSVDYVKKALKSIKETGILSIEKAGRNSTYSFKPFFALLEKFIVEYKYNQNYDIKVSELLNVKVKKKEDKDFSWSEKYKGEKEIVTTEQSQEEVQEVSQPVLPEKLITLLESNDVTSAGIHLVEKKYTAYMNTLHIDVFAEKITASIGKKDFCAFFRKCIDNAYMNNEQPKQATSASYSAGKQEVIPDWFSERKVTKKQPETYEDKIAVATLEELQELERETDAFLRMIPNNVSALEHKKQINERKKELGLDTISNVQ